MLIRFLKKIGAFVGHPRTLSHAENGELRQKGLMKPHEVAWESACGTFWLIRNNKTSELRTVEKC